MFHIYIFDCHCGKKFSWLMQNRYNFNLKGHLAGNFTNYVQVEWLFFSFIISRILVHVTMLMDLQFRLVLPVWFERTGYWWVARWTVSISDSMFLDLSLSPVWYYAFASLSHACVFKLLSWPPFPLAEPAGDLPRGVGITEKENSGPRGMPGRIQVAPVPESLHRFIWTTPCFSWLCGNLKFWIAC